MKNIVLFVLNNIYIAQALNEIIKQVGILANMKITTLFDIKKRHLEFYKEFGYSPDFSKDIFGHGQATILTQIRKDFNYHEFTLASNVLLIDLSLVDER